MKVEFFNEVTTGDLKGDLNEKIDQLLHYSDAVLLLKGNAEEPMCGFSVSILEMVSLMEHPTTTFNVLKDMEIRQGVKKVSDWPTYPQLYIKGELIGGNDVVAQLYHDGELKKMFDALK